MSYPTPKFYHSPHFTDRKLRHTEVKWLAQGLNLRVVELGFEPRWSGCRGMYIVLNYPLGIGITRGFYPPTPTPTWITGRLASSWGLPETDGSHCLPRGQPEITDLQGLASSGPWGGPCQILFPGLPPCLWPHGEVFQGLKARKRETKEGIKSRNVPWSFLGRRRRKAEKVISNFFHLLDEATK